MCDNCRQFFLDVWVVPKMTIDLPGREYEAEPTLCSLRCFDDFREQFQDDEAVGQEHMPISRRHDRVVTEYLQEDGTWKVV